MQHFDCDKIQYEGPDSKNALSFKHYNATEEVGGKAMKDHLRFGAAYWHVMRMNWLIPLVQVLPRCHGMTKAIQWRMPSCPGGCIF